MKNFKSRQQFIKESVELTEQELDSKRVPNWKFVDDLIPEGETEPLVHKGDEVYFDKVGERLIIINGGNQGMIVDLDYSELETHAIKLYNSGDFSGEKFPVYNVKVIDGESGDSDKLGNYIADFHDISADSENTEENYLQYSKEYLEKEGTTAKKFRAIVEEEAKRLGMKVHVSIKYIFDDGTGDLKEVQ